MSGTLQKLDAAVSKLDTHHMYLSQSRQRFVCGRNTALRIAPSHVIDAAISPIGVRPTKRTPAPQMGLGFSCICYTGSSVLRCMFTTRGCDSGSPGGSMWEPVGGNLTTEGWGRWAGEAR